MYGNNGTNTVIDATGVSDDDNAKWQIFTEEEMNAVYDYYMEELFNEDEEDQEEDK